MVVPDVNVLMNIHHALAPDATMQAFTSKAIAANAEARKLRTSDLLLSRLGDTEASLASVAVALRGEFEGFPVTLHSGKHVRDTFLHKIASVDGLEHWQKLESMFFPREEQMDLSERSAVNHPPLDYEDGKVSGLADYYAGEHVFDDVLILTCDKGLVRTHDGLQTHRGVFAISPQAFLSRQLTHLSKLGFASIPFTKGP